MNTDDFDKTRKRRRFMNVDKAEIVEKCWKEIPIFRECPTLFDKRCTILSIKSTRWTQNIDTLQKKSRKIQRN